MAGYLERAELLLKAEKNPSVQVDGVMVPYRDIVLQTCAQDPVYWMNHFCWTFDPRVLDLRASVNEQGEFKAADMLFNLYPFQEWAVKEWVANIFNQEDFVIEKSRDMGISWLILLIFLHFWLFVPGSSFLMGSKTEDYVDSKESMDSLFGKLRFELRYLPWWMVPEGYKEKLHATHMNLFNPVNKNKMRGEAPTSNFGRAGRHTAALLDELAFWPFADLSLTSVSQTTRCRIINSTPFGESNAFAKTANNEDNQLIVYPFADQEKLLRALKAEQKIAKAA